MPEAPPLRVGLTRHLFTCRLLTSLLFWVVHVYNRPRAWPPCNTSAPNFPIARRPCAYPRRWPCWPHCCWCRRPLMPAPTGRPFARSPSTRPTKRKSFAATCRRRSFSSSTTWNAVVPIGSPQHARPVSRSVLLLHLPPLRRRHGVPHGSTRCARGFSCRRRNGARGVRREADAGLSSRLKEVCLRGFNALNAPTNGHASRGDRTRPRSLRGMSWADAERLYCLVPSRPAAPAKATAMVPPAVCLQGRAGNLRAFPTKAPLPWHGGPDAGTVFSIDRKRRDQEAAAPARIAGCLRTQLDDRHRRDDPFRPTRGAFARRLPLLRRPVVDSAEARFRPFAAGARHGRSAHVPRPPREIFGGAWRDYRQAPPVSAGLAEIARDDAARARYLEFVRDADERLFARMIELAGRWAGSPRGNARRMMRMFARAARAQRRRSAEVDLVCSLNRIGDLRWELDRLQLRPRGLPRSLTPDAGVLGGVEGHARVLRAFTSER